MKIKFEYNITCCLDIQLVEYKCKNIYVNTIMTLLKQNIPYLI